MVYIHMIAHFRHQDNNISNEESFLVAKNKYKGVRTIVIF